MHFRNRQDCTNAARESGRIFLFFARYVRFFQIYGAVSIETTHLIRKVYGWKLEGCPLFTTSMAGTRFRTSAKECLMVLFCRFLVTVLRPDVVRRQWVASTSNIEPACVCVCVCWFERGLRRFEKWSLFVTHSGSLMLLDGAVINARVFGKLVNNQQDRTNDFGHFKASSN